MTEPQDKKDAAAQIPRVEKELPLDTRLLSEAVIELNISRKNVGIYPPGHVQITKSINRAFEILQKLFEIRPEMTLGVAKDTLLVGQDYLDQKNPVYRDFALSLNQQEIAAVTFARGLDKEELVRFHRIITTKPENIRAEGGIGAVTARSDIPHIRISTIDYGSFHVTEEQEIFKAEGGKSGSTADKAKTGQTMWRDFVSHLTAGTLAGPGGAGVSIKDAEQIDPVELANLLNERKIDSSAALQSYDQIISEHVRVRAERKQLTQEQSTTLRNLNGLLKNLHPELRKQFLSVAFRQISTHTATETDDLTGGFPDDIVIEMLSHASAEGKAISPTLTGLLGKLTRAQAQSAHSRQLGEQLSAPHGDADFSSLILPEHMEKLFDRENYESYVSDEYEATLKRLAESATAVGERIPVDEYARTLEDDHLDFQIGRALIAFMEEDIDEEDYEQFARKLVVLMPEFLKTGNFGLLLDILETLRKQAGEKPAENLRARATECLKSFSEPAFIDQAIQSFDGWARSKAREGADFLHALGPAAIPGLMDIYSIDTTPGGRRVVFDLLRGFGQDAVREAIRRLRDPRPYYVRNLIMLIRWAGTPAAIPSIRFLLHHNDVKVRMEVLTSLLRFRDPDAARLLREAILSTDPDVASQAVFLAGQYRVPDVIDDLLSLVKRVVLFEMDYTVNEEIIKALGEIGDPRVIGELERLARARTLAPQRRLKMQRVLFQSLGKYPKESISGLLKIGERMDDETIRQLCRKLKER